MRGRNLLKRKGESWEGFTISKEGDANHFQNRHSSAISTHTLRKEGDPPLTQSCGDTSHFNPHPPQGGWLRPPWDLLHMDIHFNPHPPQGGWHWAIAAIIIDFVFQPTPSARRVTDFILHIKLPQKISTHTLRKEGDRWQTSTASCTARNFNPHTPQGGWQNNWTKILHISSFQPTPSARRVTIITDAA